MKLAFDFRKTARQALAGKWWLAIAAGLIASILGGIGSSGPEFEVNFNTETGINASFMGQNFALDSHIVSFIAGAAVVLLLVGLVFIVAYFIIGSFVGVGYAKFNLDLVDGKKISFGTLFARYEIWAAASVSRLLRSLYIFLWSLLFIIPGIVAGYSYAMTDYILAENPDMTASEAIDRSKTIMYGNRWRLFCLEFSFIGWNILAFLTFGIGNLWLTPYIQAATAAFYRDITSGSIETENNDAVIETTFEEAPAEDNTNE